MNDADRFKLLHGPYRPPRCRLGKKLFCEIRGWVVVKRISDGRIQWPQTLVNNRPTFIICGDLVKAVRRESNLAVGHWWGVTAQTVTLWRKALGVPQYNEGTVRLCRDYGEEHFTGEVLARAVAAGNTPEATAKKAAARRGRPVHPKTLAALERYHRQGHSPATRRKMSETHRRLGTRPPKAGKPWTPEEDALVRTLRPPEAARRTGRTLEAVWSRRRVLGLPDGRAGREISGRR